MRCWFLGKLAATAKTRAFSEFWGMLTRLRVASCHCDTFVQVPYSNYDLFVFVLIVRVLHNCCSDS